MKQHDRNDFCVLYVEATDEKATVFNALIGQNKPVVLMLADQIRVLQRPEDFAELKHIKRQLSFPIAFVATTKSDRLLQLAGRNGFPVYPSLHTFTDALAKGQITRHLGNDMSRPPRQTIPLDPSHDIHTDALAEKTAPLVQPAITDNIFLRSEAPVAQLAEPVHTSKTASRQLTEPMPPIQKGSSSKRRLPLVLVVLTLTALLAAGLGSFLVFVPNVPMNVEGSAAASPIVGHLYFLSSEQLSENSSRGIDDEIQIDLSNLPNPATGKSYYAWLLTDKSQPDTKATLVGMLPITKGMVHLMYAGDAQHTNLLQNNSRLLVTEEDAMVPPITPSPDQSTWHYVGEISSTPIASANDGTSSTETFSYLDHLRHLLASDPLLDQMELPGGLSNWLYRNTGKILEWTGSMREHWEETPDVTFIRRQTIRTLSYLDGLSFVQQDVPPTIPLGINDRLGRIGLLPVNGIAQDPPAYLSHIAFHLNGLLQANSKNTALRTHIADMIVALNNARFWLTQVRKDAQQLMKMSDSQMHQPTTLSLLNDMIANANFAYVGQTDPVTGETQQGVTWLHNQVQSLAVLNITKYVPPSSSIQNVNDSGRQQ